MNAPNQVQITGPITLELSPPHVQVLLQALVEIPYKLAMPVIQTIEQQVVSLSQKQAVASAAVPDSPAS